MKNTYECYSYPLMKYLLSNGLVPRRIDYHNKTRKTMWIYDMTTELDKNLKEWTKRKSATSSSS